jgi:hypothetical protein
VAGVRRRPVIIEKRKWDGFVSARWRALFARDGGRMTWITPAGTIRRRPRRGGDETTTRLEISATCGRGWIVTAVLDTEGGLVRYDVDATSGGEVERGGLVAFVDLDLDLRVGNGAPAVADLIEFAQRREEMGYPSGLLSRAVLALDDALTRHWHGAWPFDGSLVTLGNEPAEPGEDGAGPRP